MAPRGRPPKNKVPSMVIDLPKQPTPHNSLMVTTQQPPAVIKPVVKPVATTDKDKPQQKIAFLTGVWEKVPLTLTILYQSYIVSLWSYSELRVVTAQMNPVIDWTNLIFSIFAGLSLDLVMVGTALRNDEKTLLHLGTLIAAWFASSAIAFNYFTGPMEVKVLHITWATMVFLFSLSLAVGKGSSLWAMLRLKK